MGSYALSRFDSPNRRKESIGENYSQEGGLDLTQRTIITNSPRDNTGIKNTLDENRKSFSHTTRVVVRRVPKQVAPIDHKNTTFLNIARKSIIEVKQHYEAITNLHKVKVDLLTQKPSAIAGTVLPEKEHHPHFPAFGPRTSMDRGQKRVIDLIPTTLPSVNNPDNMTLHYVASTNRIMNLAKKSNPHLRNEKKRSLTRLKEGLA